MIKVKKKTNDILKKSRKNEVKKSVSTKAEKKSNQKRKKKAKKMVVPFSRAIIMSVLAFVAGIGGYGGYTVLQQDSGYGAHYSEGMHRVVEVVDGDTLRLDDESVVRLIGIDAPEIGTCYGEEARKGLTKLLLDMNVEIRKDAIATDRYGRLLRYLYLHNNHARIDSIFVNEYMVENGYAQVNYVRDNSKYHRSMSLIENRVKSKKIGMWGECNYEKKRLDDYESVDSLDEKCKIKANVSSTGNRTYFVPGCPNYSRVKVEPHKGEAWYCSAEEAEKAGFKKSGGCNVNGA